MKSTGGTGGTGGTGFGLSAREASYELSIGKTTPPTPPTPPRGGAGGVSIPHSPASPGCHPPTPLELESNASTRKHLTDNTLRRHSADCTYSCAICRACDSPSTPSVSSTRTPRIPAFGAGATAGFERRTGGILLPPGANTPSVRRRRTCRARRRCWQTSPARLASPTAASPHRHPEDGSNVVRVVRRTPNQAFTHPGEARKRNHAIS